MALSATQPYKPSGGVVEEFELAASTKAYKGGLAALNAAGYAIRATDTSGSIFLGVFTETIDNTGSAGDKVVRVDIGGASVLVTHTGGSLAIANKGDDVYADGDDAVDTYANATNPMHVGKIQSAPSATTCWVKCRPYGSVGLGASIAALTENSSAIGGTNDGNLISLVDPSGDSGASVIHGIRENATKINEIAAKLNAMI